MRPRKREVQPGGKDLLTEEPLRVSCWCEDSIVGVPRHELGHRTYACRQLRCRRMNAEYERRRK